MRIFDSNNSSDSDSTSLSSKENEDKLSNGRKTVTAIKVQVKNDNRVSIFLDGKYSFSLTLDQLLEQKLKKNDSLEENKVKNLKKLYDEGKMRQRAIEWLMGRPHSTRELRDYFYRKKVEKDFQESMIEEFIEKKYLNDSEFARWFAENRARKNKSARAIRSELMSKGINSVDITTALENLETDDSDALKQLYEKIKNRPRYQDEQKLKMYLVSKGFSYSQVKQVLENDLS